MGGIFHKLFSKKLGKVELKIIILGLDNSGKTTFLSILSINTETLQLQ
jgi:GTPase SAR1 family protein